MIKTKINIITVLAVFLFAAPESYPQNYEYSYNYISINQFKVWLSNNGRIGQAPSRLLGWGGKWPGGENAFKDFFGWGSLYWGGLQESNLKLQHFNYVTLVPGKIFDNSMPDDPSDSKYRVYKLRRDWETMPFGPKRDQFENDYNEWPVEDGAPWVDIDGDGIFTRGVDQPDYIGDEILWYVSNDSELAERPFAILPEELPDDTLNIELQTTVYGYNRTGIMGDVIFIKYKLINKSNITYFDFYIGIDNWYHLGQSGLLYRGIDTTLGLVFNFDKDNIGQQYDIPPAGGELLLQAPIIPSLNDSAFVSGRWINNYKNLNISAFNINLTYDTTWHFEDITVKEQNYNRLLGLYPNGLPDLTPLK